MRYVNLSSILAFTKISSTLAEKFPTWDSFIENKILLKHEVSTSSDTTANKWELIKSLFQQYVEKICIIVKIVFYYY